MCVILCADTARPSAALVRAAVKTNPDGNGIAWLERKRVVWAKGLSDEKFAEAVASAPLPFIAHARIATCGGDALALCHPFPVNALAGAEKLHGTDDAVIFHNGTWKTWQTTMLDALVRQSKKMPAGAWSDSRAMAWLAHRFGLEVLTLLPSEMRIATLTKAGITMLGNDWTKLASGLHVSNMRWEKHTDAGRSSSSRPFGRGAEKRRSASDSCPALLFR